MLTASKLVTQRIVITRKVIRISTVTDHSLEMDGMFDSFLQDLDGADGIDYRQQEQFSMVENIDLSRSNLSAAESDSKNISPNRRLMSSDGVEQAKPMNFTLDDEKTLHSQDQSSTGSPISPIKARQSNRRKTTGYVNSNI